MSQSIPHGPPEPIGRAAAANPLVGVWHGALEPLVGREREMAELTALLQQPDIRLVTLTGPGGSGKTRLALELAILRHDEYLHGVAIVELASITRPELVINAIAQAFHIQETRGATLIERLHHELRDRELLLVLDNFEHVLDAVAGVTSLLATCPRLTALATSRIPLRLIMEHEVRVGPLSLPETGSEHQADAVRFFEGEARRLVPSFSLNAANLETIGTICRRLDGLPLAIKLAAGRSRVLDPAALLARLENRLPLLTSTQRDVPGRQRTMRDAIAWGYDLMHEHEQVLFRQLAVFTGGFTLELAESMVQMLASARNHDNVAEDMSPILLLDTLESLLNHNLIEREDHVTGVARFSMLETIREFGLERLEASGEASIVHAALAEAMTAWVEYVSPLTFEDQQAVWLARGGSEQPNIRAVLDWACDRNNSPIAYRLAAANGPIWYKRSMFREALASLERVLGLSEPGPPESATVCRSWASLMAEYLGQHDRSLHHAQAGLALARERGDRYGEGLALIAANAFHQGVGDLDAADAAIEDALACLWDLPGRPRVVTCLAQRALIAQRREDHVRVRELAQEAYDYAVEIRNVHAMADCLQLLAEAVIANGEPARALDYLAETIAIYRETNSRHSMVASVEIAALAAHGCGDHRLAVRWATVGLAGNVELGTELSADLEPGFRRLLQDAESALGSRIIRVERKRAKDVSLAQAADEVCAYRPGKPGASASSGFGAIRLTARETEVLQLLANGLTDAQIADVLFIARPTASRHVGNVLSKLDVPSRTAAVDAAHRLGLLSSPGQ